MHAFYPSRHFKRHNWLVVTQLTGSCSHKESQDLRVELDVVVSPVPLQCPFELVGMQERYRHHSHAAFYNQRHSHSDTMFRGAFFPQKESLQDHQCLQVSTLSLGEGLSLQKFLIVSTKATMMSGTATALNAQTVYLWRFVSEIDG